MKAKPIVPSSTTYMDYKQNSQIGDMLVFVYFAWLLAKNQKKKSEKPSFVFHSGWNKSVEKNDKCPNAATKPQTHHCSCENADIPTAPTDENDDWTSL
jgi:hypothetical protein